MSAQLNRSPKYTEDLSRFFVKVILNASHYFYNEIQEFKSPQWVEQILVEC